MSEIELTLFAPPVTNFLTTSTTPTAYAATAFTLSALASSSNLTTVFDQYWIKEIEVLLVPQITEALLTGGVGLIASAIDFDDANVPATMEAVSNHEHALESAGSCQHYHRFAPQFAVATYSGAFTSFSQSTGWVDCASPAVQHYGLKAFSTPTFASQTIALIARYTVRFRGIHA